MKRIARMLKVLVLVLASVSVAVLLAAGIDRLLPFARAIPFYVPTLSTMGPPNATMRFVSCDFDYVAHTNSLRLRGPEIAIERTDRFRIAVIGSSYTYGWGVNDDACFVRGLERRLNADGLNVEVINLGRNGGSPTQYALLATEVLPLLKPDLVIVAIGQGCDLEWSGPTSLREWASDVLWRLFPNMTGLYNGPLVPASTPSAPPPPPSDEDVAHQKESSIRFARETYERLSADQKQRFEQLDEKVRQAFSTGNVNPGVITLAMDSPDMYTRTLDPDAPINAGKLAYLEKYLRTIARAARKQGAPTLVISVPFGPYVNACALKNYQRVGFTAPEGMLTSAGPDEAIRRSCRDLPFLSVTDAFRKESENPRLFFELDLHMSADGHALFAAQIAPWIEEHVRAAAQREKK